MANIDTVFAEALAAFHRYSRQNPAAVATMQNIGALPTSRRTGSAALDIGAGEGSLPRLLAPCVDHLVLVEPNPCCVESLRGDFHDVRAEPWSERLASELRRTRPQGFDLVTMSHMIYHFAGIDDIRAKIALAYEQVGPDGYLVVVVNQPASLTAQLGNAFQMAEGRASEATTNRDLHATCHEARFYREVVGNDADIAIHGVDAPLQGVPNREALVRLLRMPLLDPGAAGGCDPARLDAFVADFLDQRFPGLPYPATLPDQDDLIAIRRGVSP